MVLERRSFLDSCNNITAENRAWRIPFAHPSRIPLVHTPIWHKPTHATPVHTARISPAHTGAQSPTQLFPNALYAPLNINLSQDFLKSAGLCTCCFSRVCARDRGRVNIVQIDLLETSQPPLVLWMPWRGAPNDRRQASRRSAGPTNPTSFAARCWKTPQAEVQPIGATLAACRTARAFTPPICTGHFLRY